MKRASIIALSLLVFASSYVRAEQTIQLRVSATIPPRPCEYPDRCDPAPTATQTKVIVDNGAVRYVGSPPEVTKKDDLMTVKF